MSIQPDAVQTENKLLECRVILLDALSFTSGVHQFMRKVLVSAGGLGYLPVAPGSWGSLAGVGIFLLAPGMNVRMWSNPATGHNVEILKQRGHILVGPESGWQACGHVGIGRMAEPQTIVRAIEEILAKRKPKAST